MAQEALDDLRQTARQGSQVTNDPKVLIARARLACSQARLVAKQDYLALLEAEYAAGKKSKKNRDRGAAKEEEWLMDSSDTAAPGESAGAGTTTEVETISDNESECDKPGGPTAAWTVAMASPTRSPK